MRFSFIGAGGIGAYFGGELARAGHDVTLFARGAHLEALRRRGLTVRTPDGEFVARVGATNEPDQLPAADVAIVAVKSYSLPDVIPGGSPRNPMGAAALTLSGGEYAIHGTNVPRSIGGYVSYGCIRMFNQDITDLYGRVSVGTQVVVVR